MDKKPLEEIIEISEIGWTVRTSNISQRIVDPHPLGKPILVYVSKSSGKSLIDERWRNEIIQNAPSDANAFSQGTPVNILDDEYVSPIQYYRIQ